MIRYAISIGQLESRIEAHKPGWLNKSRTKLAEILTKVPHRFPSLWSKIKDVYIVLLRLKAKSTSATERNHYEQAIARQTGPSSEHTNCLRSFVRLYESNPADGESIYDGIRKYLDSVSA